MKKKLIGLIVASCFSFAVHAEVAVHGKTFLRLESPFQSASPERVAHFSSESLHQRHKNDNCGSVQFTVMAGSNTKRSEAAAYYLPYGHSTLTFDGAVSSRLETLWSGVKSTNSVLADIDTTNKVAIASDTNATPATAIDIDIASGGAGELKINDGTADQVIVGGDTNELYGLAVYDDANSKYVRYDIESLSALSFDDAEVGNVSSDTNKNSSIIQPWNFGIVFGAKVQIGAAVVEPNYKSTIAPEMVRSFWGVGAAWRQHLSEESTGFFVDLSTSIQRVKQQFKLNESDVTKNTTAVPASWTDAGFPNSDKTPLNVTEAFAQEAWLYGKTNGAQTKTRLADVELKLGYQLVAEDSYASNMYVGVVLPTGNKADAVYIDQAIVGNGKHLGLMIGSTSEMELSSDQDMSWYMRCDADARYLFRNTQKRSFDLVNNEWSRYMMVWDSWKNASKYGLNDASDDKPRTFTPGINVFTRDMYVTPRCQARLNHALVVESGNFKGEFGWNVSARQKEKVALVEAWNDDSVAFVAANTSESTIGASTSTWNAQRTIYNDSYQTTSLINLNEADYKKSTINASQINLNSAASPLSITNRPYVSLAYGWEEGFVSFGASYELSTTNSTLSQWMLWGKLGFSF